jgi:hypothetical protein
MNKGFIDELMDTLKRLKKILKKEILIDNDNAILLKDIMTDIVNINSKINHYITDFKLSKNSKKLEELIQEQIIHEKIIDKFIPAMIAYSLLLRNEE